MWIPDGWGVQSSNETIGGDNQITDSYSVRYLLADDNGTLKARIDSDGRKIYAVLTVYVYAAARMDELGNLEPDSDGQPVIWLATQVERMLCTNPEDPGSTEVWSDYEYTDLDQFFVTQEAADVAARRMAELYAADAQLFQRDFDWDGLTPWERYA